MRAIVGSNFYYLLNSKSPLICIVGKQQKIHNRDHGITALSQINGCYSSRCLSCPKKALHKWAIWRLQSANVCEAAPNTQLKQLLAGEKYIYPTAKIVKSLHHYVLSQWKRFWVYIYALCIGLSTQMLYPNRRIEIWQVRMFVKQRQTHGWSSYLPGKNIFIPQQKSSNLYIIMFEVSEYVSDYAFRHTAATCVHKCFTREGHLKSAKNECLSNSFENTAEAVTCSLH